MDSALLQSEGTGSQDKVAEIPSSVVRRACALNAFIVLACCGSLGFSALNNYRYTALQTHSLLAFVLGLRHAVDCDHLAAIDNVTRHLLSQGQRPVSVGFWFALGHSTIVFLLTALLVGGFSWASSVLDNTSYIAKDIALVASIVSVAILAGIGLLNGYVALELFQEWTKQSSEGLATEDKGEQGLRTALSVIPFLRRVFRQVDKPVKMFNVGFLFGLSLDTATQVGLIGLATMASSQVPPLVVMVLPLCFCCGMCLVDTANGQLMLLTYSWATVEPVQKVFYNFLVTAMSAGIALAIGSFETLQIIGEQYKMTGQFWDAIKDVDMTTIGYMVIGSLFTVFVVSVIYSKIRPAALARRQAVEIIDS